MIPWLIGDDPFPAVERALVQPNGLLAAGADLSPERLIAAYRRGIFPWFSEGEPILWWSPDPRMVVFPAEFHASHSLRKRLRQGHYEVRLDSSFTEIMEACSAPRRHPGGTWISPAMKAAYARLFQLGYAHCVETWMDGELVGGLYGVALGRVFFGESMFARRTDASKIAFAHLVGWLERHDFSVIDCQMNTSHLASLGGREIPRARFCQLLSEGVDTGFPSGRWPAGGAAGMYTGARQADPA